MRKRLLNVAIAADQLLWVLLTLGHASPDETISAACWRMELAGKWQGRIFRPVIDAIFRVLFGDINHCQTAHKSELSGAHLPPSYKEAHDGDDFAEGPQVEDHLVLDPPGGPADHPDVHR